MIYHKIVNFYYNITIKNIFDIIYNEYLIKNVEEMIDYKNPNLWVIIVIEIKIFIDHIFSHQ